MENKANLAKAVIAVMKEVKGIEKSMQVGSGAMSYKGVPDQEVKKIIGDAMAKNGLCILPIGVEAKTQVDRWEETTTYNNVPNTKMKQSVFTEATCQYLLLHESGESQVLQGYGQGVDSQDKSSGKATTYSLKYTLLYTFLVPTGKIDDADNTHSEESDVPRNTPNAAPTTSRDNPEIPAHITNALNAVTSRADLEKVWTDNVGWQKVDKFLKAFEVVAKKYPKQPKA